MKILKCGKPMPIINWAEKKIECEYCDFEAILEEKDSVLVHETKSIIRAQEYHMSCPNCGADILVGGSGLIVFPIA